MLSEKFGTLVSETNRNFDPCLTLTLYSSFNIPNTRKMGLDSTHLSFIEFFIQSRDATVY